MTSEPRSSTPAPPSWSGAGVAAAFVGLGAFVTISTLITQPATSYARVGPHVFPLFVGPALALVGLGLAWEAFRGRWAAVWTETDPTARSSGSTRGLLGNVGLVAAGLVLDLLLFSRLGFTPASAILFALASRALGSRALWRDLAIGVAFAGTIQLVFAYGLGLGLPTGTFWKVLPWMS